MFKISIDTRLQSSINEYLEKIIDEALNDIIDYIATKSDENLRRNYPEGAFDTGFLAKSMVVEKEYLEKSLGYEAPYACIVGAKPKIKVYKDSSIEIGRIKNGDNVLCKDGSYHEVINKKNDLFVIDKPELILLNTSKSRMKNGLLLTDDHLILTCKDNYIFWEFAKNLCDGDIVFHPKKIAYNKGLFVNRLNRICKNCLSDFEILESELKHRKCDYCSQECYHADTYHNRNEGKHWRLSVESRRKKIGKNNPSWKGGISKLPYGNKWNKLLKEMVKKRDNYICQLCNTDEYNSSYSFHVNHIDGNKFNNDIDNLITLCPSCHGKQQWQDSELIDIDLNVFEPVYITKSEKINAKEYFTNKGALRKIKLYDLQVDGDNSFVVNGILVHNSYIEYGTSPHKTPIKPIYDWVQRNIKKFNIKPSRKTTKLKDGNTYDTGLLSLTMAIIKKIEKEGMDAKPFLRPAFNEGKVKAREIIGRKLRESRIK